MIFLIILIFQNPNAIWQQASSLPANSKLHLQDSKQNYWLSSQEGIFRVSDYIQKLSQNRLKSNPQVIAIKEYRKIIYFDTTQGLFKLSKNQLTKIEVAGEGRWQNVKEAIFFQLGFNHSGPFAYDGKKLWALSLPQNQHTKTFIKKHPNASFNPLGVYCIHNATNGETWFGTSFSGAYVYDGTILRWIYEKDKNQAPNGGDFGIRSVLIDQNKNIWINFWKYSHQYETEWKKYLKHESKHEMKEWPYFYAMDQDQLGNIWGVTFENGIWRKGSQGIDHFPLRSPSKTLTLNALLIDQPGNVLVSTNDGIYQFMDGSFTRSPIFHDKTLD